MAGTITVGTISDGTNSGSATDAIKGSCRAWVNFNATGTPSIRASYNVSSLTDNGTGNFSINFTNAMTDTGYTATYLGCNRVPNLGDAASIGLVNPPGSDFATSYFKIATKQVEGGNSTSGRDLQVNMVTVHR